MINDEFDEFIKTYQIDGTKTRFFDENDKFGVPKIPRSWLLLDPLPIPRLISTLHCMYNVDRSEK